MSLRLSLDDAAHAYWRASRAVRCETAPEQPADVAILTLIDMAGFLAKSHPPVAARAASTLCDLGLMSRPPPRRPHKKIGPKPNGIGPS